jgi:PAS domain S-box-containing protein
MEACEGRARTPFDDGDPITRNHIQALLRQQREVTRLLRLVRDEIRSGRVAAGAPFRHASGSETEERDRRILGAAPDAVIAVDPDGVISDWNAEAERLFGWSRGEAVGRRASDTMIIGPPHSPRAHEPEGRDPMIPGTGPAPTPWIETTARHRHGLEFPVEVSVTPIRTGPTSTMSFFVRDIAERKREEKRWHAAREKLEDASKMTAMRELSAFMAHEINQPLAAILANANACTRILAGPSPDLDEVRQVVTDIARAGTRTSEVVARAGAFLQSGVLNKTHLDINALIQETLVLTREELHHHQISARAELPAGLPSVVGDWVQLQQVTFNLIRNGIDAMAEVTDRPRVLRIRSQAHEEGGVLVALEDSGVGLDPRDIERIFTAFFTTKPHGIGVGLSISRSIIEAHGGRLWAAPNDERGATFQFALPAG